ncbi:MAG: D-alanyl-D-alanine carboxypeptidase [Verrucomicrobiaceae bacterium]|nr:D-alanyl-D-alanine carboxypeptidase [Verrucomicrobiaceae bacterium]
MCASLPCLQAVEEDLTAPPVVTAAAWAISDGKTGEILWQHHADEPRKAASTAKVMCALTVLRLADQQPAVLEEWITVSKVAGSTAGSTAELREGEQVRVKDALYGLLLPSGNDAGNALGEHFHARLAPPDEAMLKAGLNHPLIQSRVNFIAQMNRHAREAGLARTMYRSAFGDGGTEEDRTTTARDLCRLALVAMQHPVFRQIAATRRHEAQVKTADGGMRTAVWENSNKLLSLDLGYDGVKTGVTNQAGHCFIASGHRGADHLHVVVLGSTSDEARYADTRNLFRWAWAQRSR